MSDFTLSGEQFSQLIGGGECLIHTHPREPLGTLDFVDFTGRTVPTKLRRISWDTTDQTLSLGLEYGVSQQIGQEIYARVSNNTGSPIANGTVVGFAGAALNSLSVSPYLADGNTPPSYIVGVMTHDLPDSGNRGYCTTFGFVRGIDTSAFLIGDILYSSSIIAGALTKVKPTAPNNVIPVAVCVVSDSVNGVIFVRPSIEQPKYYGVFSDSTTQTPAANYTPYAITLNTTDISNGVIRGTPTSRVIVPQSGLYKFDFSIQVESTNASNKKIWIWPRVNGVDVPNSNGEATLSGGGTVLVPSWSWILSMSANSYFQIVYAVEDTSVKLVAKAAQVGANGTANFARPAVPSVILDVTQVQQ